MSRTSLNRRRLAGLATLASAIAVLVGASSAPGDIVAPVVTLGPTTVANGLATVSGTVGVTDPSAVSLSVNGQPLQLTAAGSFAGTVNLGGQSNLSLAVTNPGTGEVNTITIPLTSNLVGPGGVISPDVLSGLQQALVSVTRPVGGFVSVGGQPITVSGSVGNRDQLAGLSISGLDVLAALQPNGGFAVPVPGTSKEVTVLMTDKQGVSLETRLPASSQAFVSAKSALGVRIASVRYFTKRIKTTKRLRVLVTVKDRRGLLVRGAKVSVKSVKKALVRGAGKPRSTNRKGQASFVMRLRPKAFGKRFAVITKAKTPTARASKRSAVRLPRLQRAHR
jgi:hypothetical protein